MTSLSQFLSEEVTNLSGTSDNSLYYREGLNKLQWMNQKDSDVIRKRLGISKGLDRRGDRSKIIQYGRSISYPFVPNEMEVIKRSDWSLEDFGDVSIETLYHPHKKIASDWAMDHFEKKHYYFLLMQCTNKKPYCASAVSRMWYKFRDFVDFGSGAFGIECWDYSNLYPSRWLEWDHMREDHYMHFLYCEQMIEGIRQFQRKNKYKKIYAFFQHPYPMDPVTWMLEENIDNCRDWLIVITTDEFHERFEKAHPEFTFGTKIMRIPSSDFSTSEFVKILSKELSDDDAKRLHKVLSKEEDPKAFDAYNKDSATAAYKALMWPSDPKWIEKQKEEDDE